MSEVLFTIFSKILTVIWQGEQSDNTNPPDPHETQGTTTDSAQTSFADVVTCSRASTLIEIKNTILPKNATSAILEKAGLSYVLKTSVRPNSTEECKNKRLDREAC
jgi:hypothetical protein